MSEEEKIKQFEKEQLNKLLIELKDIDNFKGFENGAFKYNLGKYQANLLLEHINQLQNEHNILTEFEKWLKEEIRNVNKSLELDLEEESKISLSSIKSILEKSLDKLQELKGSDK